MCNLKAKPLRGVESNGMIVCGSRVLDEEKKTKLVRLLEVLALLDLRYPFLLTKVQVPDAKPGTRVSWKGESEGVVPDEQVSASKLGKLLGQLRTDADGNVVFGAMHAIVEGKQVTCKQIPNGVVG